MRNLQPSGPTCAGDPDGFGSFALIRDRGRVCYVLTVRNIARPVSNGVFRGRATVTGQPSFNVARPSSGNPGAASFCQSRNSSQLDAIFRDPSDYYVDVHTKRFPSSRDFAASSARSAAAAPPSEPSRFRLAGQSA